MGAQTSAPPPLHAVRYKIGDLIVCLGTAPGRFRKGQLGTIQQLDRRQLLVLLDNTDAPILLDVSTVDHADGIRWELQDGRPAAIRDHLKNKGCLPPSVGRNKELEGLVQEFFKMHDLKGNGVLEEEELCRLNQKIQMLNLGKDAPDAQKDVVNKEYIKLFRENLDARGQPIVYPIFREYTLAKLDALDPDPRVQVQTVDHWIGVAESGREAFRFGSLQDEADLAYMPQLGAGRDMQHP